MSKQETIQQFVVDDLLAGSGKETVGTEEDLIESGLIDSLAMMKLISFLEEKFSIVIGGDDVLPENFQSIEAICTFVDAKKQAAD